MAYFARASAATAMLALLWRRRAADAPIASTRRRPRHDWFRTPLLVAHDEAGYRRAVVDVKKNDSDGSRFDRWPGRGR